MKRHTLIVVGGALLLAAFGATAYGLGALHGSAGTQGTQVGPEITSRAFGPEDRRAAESMAGFQFRTPSGIALVKINVEKHPDAGNFVAATLAFDTGSAGTHLFFRETTFDVAPVEASGPRESIKVQGVPATLVHGSPDVNPNLLNVSWRKDGLTIQMMAILGTGFTRADALKAAESAQ